MATSSFQVSTLARSDNSWPRQLEARLGRDGPSRLWAIGNMENLAERKVGLFCSVSCPGNAIIAAHDAARKLREEGTTVLRQSSGQATTTTSTGWGNRERPLRNDFHRHPEEWQAPLPEGLKKFSKGSPIQDQHFDEVKQLWKAWDVYGKGQGKKPDFTEWSWIVPAEEIKTKGYDLTARNPNRPEGERLPPPMEIVASLMEKEREILRIVEELDGMLSNNKGQPQSTTVLRRSPKGGVGKS